MSSISPEGGTAAEHEHAPFRAETVMRAYCECGALAEERVLQSWPAAVWLDAHGATEEEQVAAFMAALGEAP